MRMFSFFDVQSRYVSIRAESPDAVDARQSYPVLFLHASGG